MQMYMVLISHPTRKARVRRVRHGQIDWLHLRKERLGPYVASGFKKEGAYEPYRLMTG